MPYREMLPYLENHKWPVIQETDERIVGTSAEREIQEHLLSELLSCYEAKDAQGLKDAMLSLIRSILSEETPSGS